ncbi:MAG TPA: hypothetical protein VGF45_19580 [Polyangia bacterium]
MTGVATASERIAGFVAGLLEPGHLGPPAERIVIRHLSVNDRQSDVGALALPAEADGESGVLELAGRLGDQLTADAEGLGGGVQRYGLVALRGAEVLGRLPIRLASGADDAPGDPIDSEPATARGLIAQLMRHNEANSRIVSLSMGQIVATLLRQNERLRLVAEEAEDKRYAVANLSEQLLSQQHDRDLEAKMVEERAELLRHGLTQFGAVLPYVAACFRNSKSDFLRNLSQAFPAHANDSVAGGVPDGHEPADPLGATESEASSDAAAPPAAGRADPIAGFLKSLTAQQQDGILRLLSPDQQLALFNLVGVDANGTRPDLPAAPTAIDATDSRSEPAPPARGRKPRRRGGDTGRVGP